MEGRSMDFKQVIEERRSVNFFDPARTVDRSLFRKIYELARLAPSSYDLQPWKFIEVSEPGLKKKLRAAAHGQAKVEEASTTLILLADMKGYERIGDVCDDMIVKGYIRPEEKPSLVDACTRHYGGSRRSEQFALRNAGLFAMSFCLAAKNFGVDTHLMDGFDEKKVREAFDIPERYIIAMLIAVGYRDASKTLLPRLGRDGLDEVCFEGTFSTSAPAAQV